MQSPVKDARRPDLHLPEFERPSIDLKDMKLPKIDLSDIDMPKVDVGKAVLSAAGWALMNAGAIRTRLSRAATWANEQVGAMRSGGEFEEPVAFTAAPTAPMAHPADTSLSPSATTDYPSPGSDYPDGLGATEAKATNGRSTATSPR